MALNLGHFVACLVSAAWLLGAAARPVLRLNQDGTFKLALFCDMHYGENALKDIRSSFFQHSMLRLEKPDLVVIDGDASSNYAGPTCGSNNESICREWFDARWKAFTAPLEETKTPYAYTLGNHDRIPGLNASGSPGNETSYVVPDHWIMQKDETNKHSLTIDGPASIHGASNYVLPILDEAGHPVAYVWLLDSSDNACMGKPGWGCVYPDQVEWYRSTSKELIKKDGRVLPGVMFHHIPLDEVLTAWNDPTVEVNGSLDEDVCCFSANTGFFEAIREVGNIWGVFHGHDHNNDFVALYQGVRIGYGRKSGFGGYGGAVADRRGSRVIELRRQSDGSIAWETWIRELEGGKKVIQTPATGRKKAPDACCSSAATVRPWTVGPTEVAREICRTQDDASACRAAVGLPHAVQSTVNIFA